MAVRSVLILRKPPTGPAPGRPEDRLRGCLEGRTALIQARHFNFQPVRRQEM